MASHEPAIDKVALFLHSTSGLSNTWSSKGAFVILEVVEARAMPGKTNTLAHS